MGFCASWLCSFSGSVTFNLSWLRPQRRSGASALNCRASNPTKQGYGVLQRCPWREKEWLAENGKSGSCDVPWISLHTSRSIAAIAAKGKSSSVLAERQRSAEGRLKTPDAAACSGLNTVRLSRWQKILMRDFGHVLALWHLITASSALRLLLLRQRDHSRAGPGTFSRLPES